MRAPSSSTDGCAEAAGASLRARRLVHRQPHGRRADSGDPNGGTDVGVVVGPSRSGRRCAENRRTFDPDPAAREGSGPPAGFVGRSWWHQRNGAVGWALLRFFKQIDSSVPRELDVNVVLDNLSAHSTPEIQKWLSHKNRRRWHLPYTPTSSSWLNLISINRPSGRGSRGGVDLRLLGESVEVVLDAGDHAGVAGDFGVPAAFGGVVV